MSPYLEFKSISKEFPGVRALDSVSFGVNKGSIHGLVGENGAGKSTLLKILSGAYTPSSGTVAIAGTNRQFGNTADAIAAGVSVIYQELHLVPEMTIAENLLLGQFPRKRRFFVDKKTLRSTATNQIDRLMENFNPRAKLKTLSLAQRQMIEIGKALLHNADIIAFDEPTSSLSEREVQNLFKIIRQLKEQGKAIIYVSHRLDEIFELCDTVTVFRDGKKIDTFVDMNQLTEDLLVKKMVGREIKDIYGYYERPTGEPLLQVRELTGPGIKSPVTFEARKGEILGFFGLVGAGRSEMLKVIYGDKPPSGGNVLVDGREVSLKHPGDAIRAGICFSPEDRKDEGIIGVRSVSENINISSRRHILRANFFLNKQAERKTAQDFIDKLTIRTPSANQVIGNLSGGNQQKAILARWLSEKVDIFLLDEPTRGIDVGAKYEIYKIMYQLAREGKAVIFVSSDLPEVMGVSDRIIVMRHGEIVGSVLRKDATEEKLLSMALPVA